MAAAPRPGIEPSARRVAACRLAALAAAFGMGRNAAGQCATRANPRRRALVSWLRFIMPSPCCAMTRARRDCQHGNRSNSLRTTFHFLKDLAKSAVLTLCPAVDSSTGCHFSPNGIAPASRIPSRLSANPFLPGRASNRVYLPCSRPRCAIQLSRSSAPWGGSISMMTLVAAVALFLRVVSVAFNLVSRF